MYPLFAIASLWFTSALATEHPPVWRIVEWRMVIIAAGVYGALLWSLSRRAKRDRVLDRSLALGGLVLSLVPFAGAPGAALFGIWLSRDLRRG
jgi:hypothetical protein